MSNVEAGQTIVVWFSCGAASAVAAYETIKRYGDICDVRVVNSPVLEEGWDNRRFLHDVENWLGQTIEIAVSDKYPNCSAADVWEKRKGMSFVRGAPCTIELKKEVRYAYEKRNRVDWHVLGFPAEERDRHERFILTERQNVLPVLIEAGLSKADCAQRLVAAGLKLPLAYASGLPNANCLGCVKATSPTYWNKIREIAPAVFHARAEQSRRLGARLVRVNNTRIYLDSLDPEVMGRPIAQLKMPECGLFCEESDVMSRSQGDAP